MDGQTTCNLITALCVASRGNKLFYPATLGVGGQISVYFQNLSKMFFRKIIFHLFMPHGARAHAWAWRCWGWVGLFHQQYFFIDYDSKIVRKK